MTETTTAIRAQSEAPIERVRLERPEAGPLAGSWRQERSVLVGQLAFTEACRAETLTRTKLVEVTDTHPNRRYVTAAYITGAALSVLGLALIANAQGKNEHVTCGSGSTAPRSGDRCDSEAGAWRAVGGGMLGAGLGAVLGGAIVQGKKPVVTSKDLPAQERLLVSPGPRSCGNLAALASSTVAATLSSGGRWTSTVDERGSVRIDLNGARFAPGTRATLTVESVSAEAATVIAVGTPVGELELQPLTAAPRTRSLASNR